LIIKGLKDVTRFQRLLLEVALIATIGIGGCAGGTRQSAATTAPGTASAGSDPVGAAVLSVSSPSLSFGSVDVGTATSALLSLTNNGAAQLVVSAVSVSGSGYSVSGGSELTLMPRQSANVFVNFGPTSAGYAGGTLSVVSDAANSVVQVNVSGTGVTAQVGSHSVTLSWTPSTSQVTGYNIYRGIVTGGPYAKVSTAIDPDASYMDAGLASGSYFYVVTSVDQNGVESGYSNEVAVVIP
jgi:hypothetical protein